jgi:hypothetical protein
MNIINRLPEMNSGCARVPAKRRLRITAPQDFLYARERVYRKS